MSNVPLPERSWRMFCTKCGRLTPLDAEGVQHSPLGPPFASHFGVCPCGYQAFAEQVPWTADQMGAYAAAVSAADNAALRERVRVLEDARPEPDCRKCKRSAIQHGVTRCMSPYFCTNADHYEPLPPVRLWRTT